MSKKRFLTFEVTLEKTYSRIPLTIQQKGDKIGSIMSKDQDSRFKDYPVAVVVNYIKPLVIEELFQSGAEGAGVASKGLFGILLFGSINTAISFIKIL